MIEVTDEMVQEIYSRIDFVQHDDSGIAEGLAAVFAAIERDYRLLELCREELVPGMRCHRPAHPDIEHEARPGPGRTVRWT